MTDFAGNEFTSRHGYDRDSLSESHAAADPFEQFKGWIADALGAQLKEPNAMTLATVDAHGHPAARIVLLRGWDARGFVFFTNYESAKGHDMAGNPSVALVLFWDKLERQVRVTGTVEVLTGPESDKYFASRPRGSQVGAWASPQSEPVADRAELDALVADIEQRFAGTDVTRPPFWGGYRVKPQRFEFWQGRPNRVHDRLAYELENGGTWKRTRLGP